MKAVFQIGEAQINCLIFIYISENKYNCISFPHTVYEIIPDELKI